MSLDETRLNLNGIFLQEVDSIIRAVATDGHRLSLLDTEVQNPKVKSLMSGVIIPKKSINELKKLTESFPESSVEISLDDTFMYVNAENKYFLSVRLIAREYPKYEAVIPPKTTHKLIASKDLFFTAVKRIKIMSNEKSNGVRLHLKKDEMTITANHPSLGEAREKVQVEYSGNEMEIGFNAKYLSDTLSVISEGNVSLELNNEFKKNLARQEKKVSLKSGEKVNKVRLNYHYNKVSCSHLIKQVQVEKYDSFNRSILPKTNPQKVRVPVTRHKGTPAQPVVVEGQSLRMGDVIAFSPPGELGTTYHASIPGRVSEVNDHWIEIIKGRNS